MLTPEQFQKLASKLRDPYKTMVIVAMCTGMRVSEVLALRWEHIDFETGAFEKACISSSHHWRLLLRGRHSTTNPEAHRRNGRAQEYRLACLPPRVSFSFGRNSCSGRRSTAADAAQQRSNDHEYLRQRESESQAAGKLKIRRDGIHASQVAAGRAGNSGLARCGVLWGRRKEGVR